MLKPHLTRARAPVLCAYPDPIPQICVLSPELAAVVGSNEMSRTQVVKGVWEYVRAHELQNPKDKRKIMVDELLSKVFPNKSVTMFSMNKYLSSHIKAKADVTAASL